MGESIQEAVSKAVYMPVVANDNGFAEHKVCYWEGKPGDSNIIEKVYPSRASMGSQSMTMDGKLNGVYEINGIKWTVGKGVHDPENTRSGDYATSDLNTILINHSLIASGFIGKDIKLATGLPYDNYFNEDGVNEEYIKKTSESIKRKIRNLSESGVAIISENRVYPESTAAWVDVSIDSKSGEVIAENENGVAVVDIGGNTTDVTYINAGNTINTARSGTRTVGVLHIRDKLRRLIFKDFDDTDEVTDAQLDKILRTNEFKLFKTTHNVSELVDKAVKESAEKVFNFVREKVGRGSQLDYIVFVGGGAELLRKHIEQTYDHAIVPKNPQFSNARGMLKHWTFING
ncbi:MAG: ParM/StbA family protein [gamma proteobacterium symbiont of Bathyaustriella thionipta]|nr:ParM/StbA family protein [gamma proteobacterium symbiont of Bathyaustriella thionipta]MCU7954650.1 ParM/StbA family protein [gamma proteobacterium symbiont of Bathyaustriella thionipta]MCU7957444.1 ParM/StbA family protein [gamma proteobacterium symbiont of Bathyaustriella thionipta]MCU7966100.1 ParM/StbA family protein [gamma proteobacterium symbiont of Bathyaustriella thionipta]